jgi:hypothetical protein
MRCCLALSLVHSSHMDYYQPRLHLLHVDNPFSSLQHAEPVSGHFAMRAAQPRYSGGYPRITPRITPGLTLAFLPRADTYVGRLFMRSSILVSSLHVTAYLIPDYTHKHTRSFVTRMSKLASSVLIYPLLCYSYVYASGSSIILLVLLTVATLPRHSQTPIYSGVSAFCNSFMSTDYPLAHP